MEIGLYEGIITDNDVRIRNDKEYVHIGVEVDDGYGKTENHIVKVWLTTDKAIKMARKSLKVCGFNIDEQDLAILGEDRKFLAGNSIPIEISDNPPYGKQANIAISEDKPADKNKASSLTHRLRAAKAEGEKPFVEPTKSNYGQSLKASADLEPDPWDKKNLPEATKKAQDESDGIPF